MKHLALSAALAALVLTAAPQQAQAQKQLGYALGVGAVVPVSKAMTDLSGAGVHVDGGVYWKFFPMFGAGLHISYDLPFGTKQKSGLEPDFQFTGIAARAMYAGGDFFKYWVSLGAGLYIITSSVSDGKGGFVTANNETKFGVDLSAGFGFKVWGPLSLGPAIGLTAPSVGSFSDVLILTAALRGHWNL